MPITVACSAAAGGSICQLSCSACLAEEEMCTECACMSLLHSVNRRDNGIKYATMIPNRGLQGPTSTGYNIQLLGTNALRGLVVDPAPFDLLIKSQRLLWQ